MTAPKTPPGIDLSKLSLDEKRALLGELISGRRDSSRAPLSLGQERIWIQDQLFPNNTAHILMVGLRIRGEVPVQALETVFGRVVERHEILRTSVAFDGQTAWQQVHLSLPNPLQPVDLGDLPEDKKEVRISEIFRHELRQPFDLTSPPLFRLKLLKLGPADQLLALAIHHIVCDGWSLAVLVRDVVHLAREVLTNSPTRLPELPIQYRDFAARQRARLDPATLDVELAHWLPRLAHLPVLEVPTDYPRPAYRSFSGDLICFRLSRTLQNRIEAFCRNHGVTPFMTLLAAFKVLLACASGEKDIAVRSPFSGRDRPELEGLIGFFVKILVFRSQVLPEETFLDLVRRVKRVVLDGLEHRELPFEKLMEATREQWLDPSRAPGAQIGFVLNRQSQNSFSVAGRTLEFNRLHSGTSQLDLTLFAWIGNGIELELEYNTALYRRPTIESFARLYRKLLEELLRVPERALGDLTWMNPAQHRALAGQWTGQKEDSSPPPRAVHRLFEDQVKRRGATEAVVWGGTSMTYRKLNQRANRLARQLRERGVGPELLVAVALPRSGDLVSLLLAILKTGGAYLPLDPSYPPGHLRFILQDSRPRLLVTTRELAGKFTQSLSSGAVPPVLPLEELEADPDRRLLARNQAGSEDPDKLAYVIYTSGSSGRPRGVEIPRRALNNQLCWMNREFRFGPRDRILQRTPLGFDASIWEFFAPLTAGATLILAPPEASLDMVRLVQTVREQQVTHLQLVPSLLRILLEEGSLRDCPSLKVVFSGGEVLTADLQTSFHEQSRAELVNLYGPTETCINASFHRCLPGESGIHAPLGRPIDNLQFHILSARLNPLPPGLPGELCIAGMGLGRGYLGRPAETRKSFVDHPFGEPGEKLYRTGDRVRITSQGNLQFLGRLDLQLKVNGARIEPAEIEAALRSHPAVRNSVVVLRADLEAPSRLIACVVPRSPGESPDLRPFLEERLPRFMIPAHFVWVDEIPLTPSGKVDYRALPDPAAEPVRSVPLESPRNPTETLLHTIWKEVLAVDELSIHDNFFELGGASLQVIQVAARAHRQGCDFAPALLFQNPTIAGLGEAISRQDPLSIPPQDSNEDFELPAALRTISSEGRPRTRALSRIESLGVYLPPREVTTEEVIRGCRRPVRLPLKQMTGIESRRMAGEKEFSFDLARQAVAECLRYSRYQPAEIDLLLCCNISRFDAPRTFSYEPSTAIRLKAEFGFDQALTFDLTNACAGLFTGIYLAHHFLADDIFQRCLIVSGEYITHLTQTAQKEISEFLDPRLACLTLGDAGAALVLEKSPDGETGFHGIHLLTLAKYSPLCVARATEQEHGGAIMHTDLVQVSATATRNSMVHAALMLRQTGWSLENFDRLIAHQTSRNALRGASREINRLLGREATGENNLVDNLSHRGNTASTSHLVALWDGIQRGTILDGSRVLFSITGSGQTVGTAIYRFDDLPTRIRSGATPPRPPSPAAPVVGAGRQIAPEKRIRIESVGTLRPHREFRRDALWLASQAAEECLRRSRHQRHEIGALIHCGTYRNDFLTEPALAAFLAARLEINHEITEPGKSSTTLAFDLCNGPLGIFNGCLAASSLIRGGACRRVLLTASEIENNAFVSGRPRLGLKETGSAMMLDASPDGTGFGDFLFRDFPAHIGSRHRHGTWRGGVSFLEFETRPGYLPACLAGIESSARQLLADNGLRESDVRIMIPPGISPDFDAELSDRLGIPRACLAETDGEGLDLAGSALALGFQDAVENRLAGAGDIGLLIGVSPGIQIGCALYYF